MRLLELASHLSGHSVLLASQRTIPIAIITDSILKQMFAPLCSRGSISPQSGPPPDELPGLAELDSPSKAAFRHLHFNPVFGDRAPGRLKRLGLQDHRAAHKSGPQLLEASLSSIAGECLGSELLQEQPDQHALLCCAADQ